MTPDLVLSLFPGLELLDRAFREVGFCVVAGPDRVLGGDVRDFHPPAGIFGGVIGGSPCQSFSALANLVRARGFEPRFGNLIPEFERVAGEAAPAWWLHENVPAAPVPVVEGYAVADFLVCNSSIEGEDGLGQEQERVRRFAFGVRGAESVNLLRWIPRAALRLPAASRARAVSAEPVDNSPEAKGRVPAVCADARERPVALGGSGKPKRSRARAVHGGHGETPWHRDGDTGRDGEAIALRPGGRRPLAEMLRLQGLPPDYLDEQPFRMDAARKLVANGVPMATGRAVARAVREALKEIATRACV